MNYKDQPVTPFSCYRIDPSFLCAPTSQTSVEADSTQDYTIQSLVERFELLPDNHDEDSIFSDDSATKQCSPETGGLAVSETRISMHRNLPSNLFMPSLQPRGESNMLPTMPKKMDLDALAEEMASPLKSRQNQLTTHNSDKEKQNYDDPAQNHDLVEMSSPSISRVDTTPSSGPDDADQKFMSDKAQSLDACIARQTTMQCSNISEMSMLVQPKKSQVFQQSNLEFMPSHETASYSSVPSEVECHDASKPRSSSCNSTAHTADTWTGDISSKNSSEFSERSHGESKYSHEHELSTSATDDYSPTTAIYGLTDNSIKASDVQKSVVKRDPSANSASFAFSHRYARHRNSFDKLVERPVAGVPLNHLSREIEVSTQPVNPLNGASMEELYQLRQWAANASKLLEAKESEVETLKQYVSDHGGKVELLKSKACEREKAHSEEMQRIIGAKTADIRELEQALERDKSTLLAQEMALSAKNQQINESIAEMKELRSEMSSLMAAKSADNPPQDDIARKRSEEFIMLSSKCKQLEMHNKELLKQVEIIKEKRDGYCQDISRLNTSIESKTKDNYKLRKEIESYTLALAECREENSSLHDKYHSLLAELESANVTILQSTEEIASLHEDSTRYFRLHAKVEEYEEKIKLLQKENISACARLESKSICYKDLAAKTIDHQDKLKVAERKISEANDEASALRVKVQEIQAVNKIISAENSDYQEKLSLCDDHLIKLRTENTSLEAIVLSKSNEIQHLRQQIILQRDVACNSAASDGDLVAEISALRDWKQAATESIDSTKKELTSLSKSCQELVDDRKLLRERLELKLAECKRLHHDNKQLIIENEVAKASLAEALSKNTSLQINLNAQSSDNDKLQQELLVETERYESTLAQLKAHALSQDTTYADNISKLQRKVAIADTSITRLTAKSSIASNEITSLRAELNAAENEVADAVNQVEELEGLLSKSRDALQWRESECERLSIEIKTYQDRLKIADDDYISLRLRFDYFEQLSEELNEKKSECENLKIRVSELEHQLSNEELAVISFDIAKLKKENLELLGQVKDLEYDVVDYKEEASRRAKELSASKAYCEELEHSIQARTGEELCQDTITSLRGEVERLTIELEDSIRTLVSQNHSLEQDISSKSEQISALTAEISSLKINIQDLQDNIVKERGPRVDALNKLQSDLQEKEQLISKQLIEIKNASNEAAHADAKFVSLKLMNESVMSERDDLRQWKHDAEGKIQALTTHIEDLTSQTKSLQTRCQKQEAFIQVKDSLTEELNHKVKSKKFALARYEEDMIMASKEISVLKAKCQELETLSSNIKSNEKQTEYEILLSEKAELESKIQALTDQEKSLMSQLSTLNAEKIALAKSSLDMAEAYEEKIKNLQEDVGRTNAELELRQNKYEQAQAAVKSLNQALLAVERQHQKRPKAPGVEDQNPRSV